ncbi:putative Vacuolar protein sorting protein [Taphrina deformans PYCC 5710]|uniref:E3 ubiquitin-protein ligase PEP5 n=1 Tax=Taphrina deformans (strain PYCC 5710 / ATCC 11124 / CBS 356.35 / IMI 108563 / JCM 9778 / NBRC 8474) TaxID=1097556 RepID=R4ZY26_TAPDE|nr:putative Vacuolar protein sorting protein [Taphrina deformans PYCC 5710]|eukprot:CCX35423.1 putative Vacuolar protein sorting protein [Taphrina deformans PYCC 5710]
MASAWRQFNFFQSVGVKDATNSSLSGPAPISIDLNDSIISAGKDWVFVGRRLGTLHALDQQFREVADIPAYLDGRIDHVLACTGQLVATIGEESSGSRVLKVWELRKIGSSERLSFKHLSAVVVHTDQPYPITCFAALRDLGHVAVGFSNGKVILIKGDLARDRGAKQRVVYEGEEPITRLEFLLSETTTTLYIFSTSKLLTLTTSNANGKSVTQIPRVMESVGAALGCVTKDESKNEIIVVRQDAIYVYGIHGRGPCFALEGPKTLVHTHGDYVIVIRPPNGATKSSFTSGNSGLAESMDGGSQVTVLNTAHKFIAHSGYFSQGLKTIFSRGEALYLLTLDGKLFNLQELEIEPKLDILFAKNMYTLALNLAQESGADESLLNSIQLRYGDFLYSKGEYEQSVSQYVLAVRRCQASTVMRKFLEAQHIPLLTEFLEALHNARLANADYTTLLLNCYAKLDRREKMAAFIRDEAEHPIDLDIAVALCRQASYFDEALALAAKHRNHTICLGIMIEDQRSFGAALAYIRKLREPSDIGIILNNFGRELMLNIPAETTKIFIDFYTGSFMPENNVQPQTVSVSPHPAATGYGGTIYDSMINSRYTQVLPSLPSLDMSLFNPMKRTASNTSPIVSKSHELSEHEQISASVNEERGYNVPNPRTAFPIFADFPLHFVQFLEAILERQSDVAEDTQRSEVVSTLLELYLRQARDTPAKADRTWETKAKALMQTEADCLENSKAMLIFHLSKFEEGSLLLQERAGRREDVFRSRCTVGDTVGVIKLLRQYGEEEPIMYTLALKYFISSPKTVQEAGPELATVLSKIQEKRLLAPLQVVQALSSNAVATVGIVKEYLSSMIERERKEIASNQSLIASYRKETEEKAREVTDLATNARVLQVSRCSGCSGTLELPVVHFLCKHSFHQRCVTVATEEISCPICLESSNTVKAIIKNKTELAERQEFFKEGLAASRDKANFLFSRLDLNIEQAVT